MIPSQFQANQPFAPTIVPGPSRGRSGGGGSSSGGRSSFGGRSPLPKPEPTPDPANDFDIEVPDSISIAGPTPEDIRDRAQRGSGPGGSAETTEPVPDPSKGPSVDPRPQTPEGPTDQSFGGGSSGVVVTGGVVPSVEPDRTLKTPEQVDPNGPYSETGEDPGSSNMAVSTKAPINQDNLDALNDRVSDRKAETTTVVPEAKSQTTSPPAADDPAPPVMEDTRMTGLLFIAGAAALTYIL
jgi:hypothetical protein